MHLDEIANWSLVCPACGKPADRAAFARGCASCLEQGDSVGLVVAYDDLGPLGAATRQLDGIWKHRGMLPRIPAEFERTIGEADTPLVQVPALAKLTGNDQIYLKLDMCNPTAAHKDRFHSVAMGVGRAMGFDSAISWSTGNHGFSMASYANAHGMRAVVVGSPRMPPLIQKAIRFVGGLPIFASDEVNWALMTRLVDEGWYPSTNSWDIPVSNPFGIEGYKTIGYEVFQQLGDSLPDLMLFPAAAGDGVLGVARAIADLHRIGATTAGCRLVACQPAGAAPLVNALDKQLAKVAEIPNAYSRALSIGDPISGNQALRVIRESNGFGVAIPDDEIMAAGRLLAKSGLLVEPSSAASVAGAIKAIRERPDLREQRIVCLITSSGLKWLDDYSLEPLDGAVHVESVDDALRAIDRLAA
jgi:threonine synthase